MTRPTLTDNLAAVVRYRRRLGPNLGAYLVATRANRRARRRGAEGVLTWRGVAAVTGSCVYCGTTENVGWDHVIALSRGGPNTADNLVRACLSCNKRKGADRTSPTVCARGHEHPERVRHGCPVCYRLTHNAAKRRRRAGIQ